MTEMPDDWGPEDPELYIAAGGIRRTEKNGEETWDFGFIPEEELAEPLPGSRAPAFSTAHADLLGAGAGQTTLLYEAARQVMGRDLDIGPQKSIDCVSWGVGGAIDLRACVEVLVGEREAYAWDLRVCTEALHALARVEHSGGIRGTNSVRGTIAARDGGTLSRRLLGPYSGARAEAWAKSGLPDQYEAVAREHRARDISRVDRFSEARDAIFNGYPVVVGSNIGFRQGGRRDNEGFAQRWGRWRHCMKFVAEKDDQRPGLLCINSWSPNAGPKGAYAIPDGSFWVDARDVDAMLGQGGGFAIGGFEGYGAT